MGLRGEAIRHQPVKDRLVVQEAPADELHAVRCQDKLLEVFVGQKAEITGLPLLEPDGLGLKVKEGQIAAADGAAAATAAPTLCRNIPRFISETAAARSRKACILAEMFAE